MAGLGIALMMGAWPALNMQIKLCLWQDQRELKKAPIISAMSSNSENTLFWETLNIELFVQFLFYISLPWFPSLSVEEVTP